jgi:hypothetical protein
MSNRETPMTEAFWQQHAHGAFIPEYCLVRRAGDCGGRYVDALILPDEPPRRASLRAHADE